VEWTGYEPVTSYLIGFIDASEFISLDRFGPEKYSRAVKLVRFDE